MERKIWKKEEDILNEMIEHLDAQYAKTRTKLNLALY